MVDRVLRSLAEARALAEAHPPRFGDDGVARVCDLMIAVVEDVQGGSHRLFVDPEFGVTLVTELTRRFLQAIAAPHTAPCCWQAIVDSRGDATVAAVGFADAAGNALVRHDLAPAVVTTCTVLGNTPAAAERTDCAALVALVEARMSEIAVGTGVTVGRGGVAVATGTPAGAAPWEAAMRLWAIRGRPAAAAAHRADLDRTATALVRAALRPGLVS